ncbi:MAG: hypothetical protein RBR69_10280 [Candidatus Cloacimonadaceae bacterium]|nr:hypothetical protein [Candidatus Cloacimonadota bacterium]MDY0128506.1 hypothetical protein [Candidatus Cloacimonadaceae bacterium]
MLSYSIFYKNGIRLQTTAYILIKRKQNGFDFCPKQEHKTGSRKDIGASFTGLDAILATIVSIFFHKLFTYNRLTGSCSSVQRALSFTITPKFRKSDFRSIPEQKLSIQNIKNIPAEPATTATSLQTNLINGKNMKKTTILFLLLMLIGVTLGASITSFPWTEGFEEEWSGTPAAPPG